MATEGGKKPSGSGSSVTATQKQGQVLTLVRLVLIGVVKRYGTGETHSRRQAATLDWLHRKTEVNGHHLKHNDLLLARDADNSRMLPARSVTMRTPLVHEKMSRPLQLAIKRRRSTSTSGHPIAACR